MCKKMLQSLMGGGSSKPAAPAERQTPYKEGKEGIVLGTPATDAAIGGTGQAKLGGGLVDPKRRNQGVPGLGL